MRRHTRTSERLGEAWRNSPSFPLRLEEDRYVIFSDVHMADRTPGVDDFVRNEMIYCHALQHYYDQGYNLILNGDIEEGWECKPRAIREAYFDTAYALERRFAIAGSPKHIRIYGNHDSLWENRVKVQKFLWPALGEVTVFPGVRLGEHIFVTHGHQGDWLGDTISVVSHWSVRHGWRWLQRLTRLTNARAATQNLIRQKRDAILYQWALDKGILLVAGHTHRSMFGDVPESGYLSQLLEHLEKQLPQHSAPYEVMASIDYLHKTLAQTKQGKESRESVPCYFNSGSCVHVNGITGIEIDRGEIRLTKWQLEDARSQDKAYTLKEGLLFAIERKIYQQANLCEMIDRIRTHNSNHNAAISYRRVLNRSTEMDAAA